MKKERRLLYVISANQPIGNWSGLYFLYLEMPVIWLAALISLIVFTIRGRKIIFFGVTLKWTLLAVLFCTPIPMIAWHELM
jgi:hypothetical protein